MRFEKVIEETDLLFTKIAGWQPTEDYLDYIKTVKKVKKGKRASYFVKIRNIRTKM